MGRVVVDHAELTAKLKAARKNKKVVFTNGCFDILHVGHVRYLQEAKTLGDILVVGLNTDKSVQAIKGPTRPLQSESDRAEIMAALTCVDFVTLFGEETPAKLIEAVRPDILVKGGDWPVEKIVGAPFVMSYGGQVKTLQFVKDHSTSRIIERMKS